MEAMASRERPELQVVDYFLWTLQRFYDNGDERYLSLMWPQYQSVCYMHPIKSMTYYTKKEPLNKAALEKFDHEGLPKI